MSAGVARLVTACLLAAACTGSAHDSPSSSIGSSGEIGESDAPLLRAPMRCDVLTYNVLASPIFMPLRLRAVSSLLESSDADVIALQEVSPEILAELSSQPWFADYHPTAKGGRPFAPGGQLVLSRAPITRVDVRTLPGRQRRTVLVADTQLRERPITFATTHLESFLEDGPTRARQLAVIFEAVRDEEDVVVLGDLNFGDGEQPETSALDGRFVDVWSALRPGVPGFTWHQEENPLARIGSFVGEPNRRLDRVLLAGTSFRPEDVAILGDRPAGRRRLTIESRRMIEVPARPKTSDEPIIEVFPSDHYGVCVRLSDRRTP